MKTKYDAIVQKANSSFWSENRDASQPWTNYIGVMPQRNIIYYRYTPNGSGSSTMTYYGEDLNGTYQMIFSVTFAGTNYTVSDEDRYEFEGFTYDHGTNNGTNCNGAKFYYRRNEYELKFYTHSNNTADKAYTNVKYQETLSRYDYRSGQEIIFYYTQATSMRYTVYYQDANGNDLIPSVTKTTEYSTVTEQYVSIPNYAPRQFSITQDLSSDETQNKIVFIYDPTLTTLTIRKSGCDAIDEGQTFLFSVRGTDENTRGIALTVTVHGNGKTTVAELPVGSYTVTEMTDWSWRYTPEGGAAQTVTAGADGAELTFVNGRTEEKWLDGGDFAVNLFGVTR